jgi:hypothetical protein
MSYVSERLEEGLHLIPGHMHDGVRRYVLQGIPMDNFGTAIFANDFMSAAVRADQINAYALLSWVQFIYNYVPSGCHGSYDLVKKWCKQRGASDA